MADNAIVQVIVRTYDDKIYQGTGFFIRDRAFITNYHMVRNAKDIAIMFANGKVIKGGKLLTANPKL
jgi:S1-C subfamily serine protease